MEQVIGSGLYTKPDCMGSWSFLQTPSLTGTQSVFWAQLEILIHSTTCIKYLWITYHVPGSRLSVGEIVKSGKFLASGTYLLMGNVKQQK